MSILFLDPAQLRATIDKVIPHIPAGHTDAIVGTVDQQGVQLLVTATFGAKGHWKLSGIVRHDWTGNDSVATELMYSWKRPMLS